MKIWLIIGAVVVVAVVIGIFVSRQKEEQTATPTAQVQVPTATDPRAAQKQFLVDNLKQPGWQATPSGLEYKVVKNADPSAPKPAPGATVTINYEGRFIDGRVFDKSQPGQPVTFPLPQLIPGWQEGVPMMRIGETWEFAIPSNLGYGDQGGGPIPGGSTLVFTIDLLDAKPTVQ